MKKRVLPVLALAAILLFPTIQHAQWVENDTIYVRLKTGRTIAIGVVNDASTKEAPALAARQIPGHQSSGSLAAMAMPDAGPDENPGAAPPPPDSAAVAASIQQWRIDYNKASPAEVMAAHYVTEAMLLGTEGERTVGAAAIGRAFGNYQNTRPELTSIVDEVLLLPGGYAYSTVRYTNKIKNLADGTVQTNHGVASTLHQLEGERWKIVRQTLVSTATQP